MVEYVVYLIVLSLILTFQWPISVKEYYQKKLLLYACYVTYYTVRFDIEVVLTVHVSCDTFSASQKAEFVM
jgi:hypothetical protein